MAHTLDGPHPVIHIDVDTVKAAQAGEESACRSIIETMHRPVLSTLYRFLGPGHREDLEDLAQEVFLKLFRSIARFDPERGVKFTTWAYTFVRNHCFDVMKKRRLRMLSLQSGASHGGDNRGFDIADSAAEQPEHSAENRELGQQIQSALLRLGEEQRLAFVLREYEGLDYGTIAEVMGVSEGTIKSRLHRAKSALRAHLAPYLEAQA